jgi:hypothetical protein
LEPLALPAPLVRQVLPLALQPRAATARQALGQPQVIARARAPCACPAPSACLVPQMLPRGHVHYAQQACLRPSTPPHHAKAPSAPPEPSVCVAPHTTSAQRGVSTALPERGLRWLAPPLVQAVPCAQQEAGAIAAPQLLLRQPAPFARPAGSQAVLAAPFAPWQAARVLQTSLARQAPPPAKLQRAPTALVVRFQRLVPLLALVRPATPAAMACWARRRATFARVALGARKSARSLNLHAAEASALWARSAH